MDDWDDDYDDYCSVMCVIGYLAAFIVVMGAFAAVLWLAY